MDFQKNVIRRILNVALISVSIYLIYWLGFKGMIGIVIGMITMSYVLLTENLTIRSLLGLIGVTQNENKFNTKREIETERLEKRKYRIKFKG